MIRLAAVTFAACAIAVLCLDAAGTFWAPVLGIAAFLFACAFDLSVTRTSGDTACRTPERRAVSPGAPTLPQQTALDPEGCP